MTHSRKLASMLACCAAASVLVAGHATAREGFVEHVHFQDAFVEENFCGVEGLTVDVAVTADQRLSAVPHGRDGLVYHLNQFRETLVYTNPATGKTITYVSSGINGKDLKITDNGDGTLTILTQLTGKEALYGGDGELIYSAIGMNRFAIVIDHGGTPTDESDDEFVADLGQIKRSPPHGNSDACTPAVEALT